LSGGLPVAGLLVEHSSFSFLLEGYCNMSEPGCQAKEVNTAAKAPRKCPKNFLLEPLEFFYVNILQSARKSFQVGSQGTATDSSAGIIPEGGL